MVAFCVTKMNYLPKVGLWFNMIMKAPTEKKVVKLFCQILQVSDRTDIIFFNIYSILYFILFYLLFIEHGGRLVR